jgi:predicted membrane protein
MLNKNMDFDKEVSKAEKVLDMFFCMKILVLLFIAVIILIIFYGQWLTASLVTLFYLYYRKLIIRYREKVLSIKKEKKE